MPISALHQPARLQFPLCFLPGRVGQGEEGIIANLAIFCAYFQLRLASTLILRIMRGLT